MRNEDGFTSEALRLAAEHAVRHLRLPYLVEASEDDPWSFRFSLRTYAGEHRATVVVTRTAGMTPGSLMADLVRELYKTLIICVFCMRESKLQRYPPILEITCPRCGRYRMDLSLVREICAAQGLLAQVAHVGSVVRRSERTLSLDSRAALDAVGFDMIAE